MPCKVNKCEDIQKINYEKGQSHKSALHLRDDSKSLAGSSISEVIKSILTSSSDDVKEELFKQSSIITYQYLKEKRMIIDENPLE